MTFRVSRSPDGGPPRETYRIHTWPTKNDDEETFDADR